MGKTTIFFLPPSRHRTQEIGRSTVEGGRGADDLAHGDGKWGETKRRSRATDSAPYLGLGCSGEADRRGGRRPVMVVGGGGAWGLGGREAWLGWCVARWGAGPALL
jgi:hypothetical protein